MLLLAWLLSLAACQALEDKSGPTVTERPDLDTSIDRDTSETGLVNFTSMSDEGGERDVRCDGNVL